jgi:hypothetical protein
MSASASRNNNSNNNSKKPYCKVCHDAGKLEREYTNHYVKTYDVKVGVMKVTCPTLLSLECRYCGKNGHTVKFCQVLEETKKQDAQRIRERERREQQIQVQAQQVQAQAQRRPKNAFELLEEDEQEVQNEVKNEVKNEFPALGKSSSANSSSANSSVSWASRASTIPQPKPKPEPEPEPVQKPVAKKNVRPVLPNARGSNNWEYDIEDYGEYLYYNIAKYYPENAEKIVWMLADLDSSELDELATNPAALKQTADEANEILEADAIKALAMTRTLAEDNDW